VWGGSCRKTRTENGEYVQWWNHNMSKCAHSAPFLAAWIFLTVLAWAQNSSLPHSVIKGMSLFHCHLLNHEDKGMMAKILFK